MNVENIHESLIFPHLDASSQEEVFEKMGGALIEQGFCKETYVDALKEREAHFSTGVDVGASCGVAIPHTDVSHVKKAAVAVATLDKPVSWIHMGTEDVEVEVQVIFMLAIDDPNSHLDQLQNVIQPIQQKEIINKMADCDSQKKIIEVIKGAK